MTLTVAEKIPHCFGVIANDNYKSADARIAQSFYNVLQNRFAAHFDHRFRKIDSEFAHARAASGCQHDRFVDLGHIGARLIT
jgi:hypothetical protein